jgi:N-ethylmaleimide reductase
MFGSHENPSRHSLRLESPASQKDHRMTSSSLQAPARFGDLELANRIVMAPMTRNRAGPGNVPTELMGTYYRQRAGAGLIVTEASQVVPEGQGYPATPGIHSEQQVAGWKRVVEAVQAAGGRIVLQLWHVGRVSHSGYQPGGKLPVAPSAIAPAGQVYGTDWKKVDYETPRALELSEISTIIEGFVKGAENAQRAGFDGVEVHGANGYLLDQFLRDGSNKRTDAYGGSAENRARLLLETVEAVAGVYGASRVGVRLSPHNPYNDMKDTDPLATFGYVARALAPMKLAFVHLVEPLATPADARLLPAFKADCGAPVITNGDYTREAAEQALAENRADAVAFAKLFLANPDLPKRFATGAPLNEPDFKTFFGGTEKGYTDYPALSA